jgi:hypothetical protein
VNDLAAVRRTIELLGIRTKTQPRCETEHLEGADEEVCHPTGVYLLAFVDPKNLGRHVGTKVRFDLTGALEDREELMSLLQDLRPFIESVIT